MNTGAGAPTQYLGEYVGPGGWEGGRIWVRVGVPYVRVPHIDLKCNILMRFVEAPHGFDNVILADIPVRSLCARCPTTNVLASVEAGVGRGKFKRKVRVVGLTH